MTIALSLVTKLILHVSCGGHGGICECCVCTFSNATLVLLTTPLTTVVNKMNAEVGVNAGSLCDFTDKFVASAL